MEQNLREIYNLVRDYKASVGDMLVSTLMLLNKIEELADTEETEMDQETKESIQEDNQDGEAAKRANFIIVSCDASIKKNPGGPASIGYVVSFPEEEALKPMQEGKPIQANTINEAEYSAIYEALVALFNRFHRPKYPVIVRSDSKLVVNQLKGEYKINHDSLQRRCDSIHELCSKVFQEAGVPVTIEWHPRNSTPELTTANFLAQDVLGVPRH